MINQVRWLRVVIAAFLVELGLAVLGLPLLAVVGEAVVFNVVVPILCVIVPFVVVWLATRKLPAARFLHGWLIGIVATLMYFALVIGDVVDRGSRCGVRRRGHVRRHRCAPHRQRRSRRLLRRPTRGPERGAIARASRSAAPKGGQIYFRQLQLPKGDRSIFRRK